MGRHVIGTASAVQIRGAPRVDNEAHGAADVIICSKGTAVLYYEPDGSGSDGHVKIASVSKNLKMTHQGFLVI